MNTLDSTVLNFSTSSLLLMNAILAVVMFSIALDLKPRDFGRLAAAPKPVVTGLISQFVVLPVLTYLLILVVQPRASIALGLILVAACPGGNISNFITHRAGGNAALSVSMTAFATVGAILITPLNIAFWGRLYAPSREILNTVQIDPVQVAITVSLMLILPLILGMVLNARYPELADRVRRPMQNLSMLICLAFVVLALAANWGFFLSFAQCVGVLVVVHNALALAGGYGTATLAGLSSYDRRAITIETGIQNSGLGAGADLWLFQRPWRHGGGGALWGIWHAVSGIVLARIMARTEATR
ncbi:bile acid:sodium symporter family protein [Pseudophaeobacter leonis]|uniref:bile acid:sodium symporter family protein n=1 Tax=Pseudophaeobacter leonis TaxID=1144477 RepID=UPI001F4DF825|nr:bile acid:sodium symporter family protein [Pseudophaeobacter leonis]